MSFEIKWPDAGELQRRVVIRLLSDTANSSFGIDHVVDAGITRWAKLEPLLGVAYWGAAQVGEDVTHRVWVRWATGTKPENLTKQHVVDYPMGNRRFRVVRAINVNDAQMFTAIECKDLGVLV